MSALRLSLLVATMAVGITTGVSALEHVISQDESATKVATYRESGWRIAQNKGDMNGLKDRMKAGDNSVGTKDRMKAGDNSVGTKDRMKASNTDALKDRMKAGDNSGAVKDRMKAGDNSEAVKDRMKKQ